MERNVFLEIEYIGTRYFGSQVQKSGSFEKNTVQGELEKALLRLFCRKVKVHLAGRTDRGVHALGQAANFRSDKDIPAKNIKCALNKCLPLDIKVKKCFFVPLDFHARYSATSKIYRYIIACGEEDSVFMNCFSWYFPKKLSLDDMVKAGRSITGKMDFCLFAKDAKKYKDGTRTIKRLDIFSRGRFIYIDIEADGFLRSMARSIVYFLVQAGSGGIKYNKVRGFAAGQAACLNRPAPAQGLYLMSVNYPASIFYK